MSSELAVCACGRLAVWEYVPADGLGEYCDECVPRGCSCNVIDYEDESPDAEQHRDEHGRLVPCVEYEFWEDGFKPTDPEDIRAYARRSHQRLFETGYFKDQSFEESLERMLKRAFAPRA